MLLHANHLNAGVIDGILRVFEEKGYQFVTLAAAQSDPAYKTPDTFISKSVRCGDTVGPGARSQGRRRAGT